jgi:hypothetical protein
MVEVVSVVDCDCEGSLHGQVVEMCFAEAQVVLAILVVLPLMASVLSDLVQQL